MEKKFDKGKLIVGLIILGLIGISALAIKLGGTKMDKKEQTELEEDNDDSGLYSDYDSSETEEPVGDYSTSQSEVTNGDEIDIWVCAQDIVEKNLKSPSSSDFCSVTDAKVYSNGGDNYTVYGYVDAKNGFGAEIRTNFTVTLTYTGSGYTNGVVVFE